MVLYSLIVAAMNLALGMVLGWHFAPRVRTVVVEVPAEPEPTPNLPTTPVAERPAAEPAIETEDLREDDDEPTPEIPSEWLELLDETERGNTFVEASIHVLKLEVGRYRDQLIRIDRAVRGAQRAEDATAIPHCLEQLKKCNEDWLARQGEAAGHLRERQGDLGEFSQMGNALEETLLEQTAQIETTCSNIEHLDFETNTATGCQRLVGEICKLVDMAHNLRDRMHESLLSIVQHEGRLDTLDKRLQLDPLTGLFNRSGLEKVLWEWWRDDPSRKRLVSLVMLDIDRFARLNEKHGVRAGDKLIESFSNVLSDLLRKDRSGDVTSRYSGQRFVLVLGDTGPRAATSAAERIRQTIEATSFEHERQEIQLTVSCGVTEIGATDSSASLFARLERTLRDAKKGGRNITRLDEGHGPVAVEPPTFEVKGRIIHIDTDDIDVEAALATG